MTEYLDAIAEATDKARTGRWPFAELTPQQKRAAAALIEAKRDGKLARWPDGIQLSTERTAP